MHHTYTYLALGDSYTIGEGISLTKSFPYQAVALLRKDVYDLSAPEIIAKTGWTSDELEEGINSHILSAKYDIVTLLIGVNNQYRGRDIAEFKQQFENLLNRSIELANGKKDHVFVISIPDYGVTPFAKIMDSEKITKEIDEYNNLQKAIAIQYKVHYIDITEGSRKAKTNLSLVANDGLHPSEKEYAKWAKKLVAGMKLLLKK